MGTEVNARARDVADSIEEPDDSEGSADVAESGRARPGRRFVFIGGAPRSGTTWLQLLLADTGRFATAQETHLFPAYIRPLLRQWEASRERGGGTGQREIGLHLVLSRQELRKACLVIANSVLRNIQRTNPDADWILEKTPENLTASKTIFWLYPRARMLGMVRDPRAVVASIRAAATTWAGKWAPDDVNAATLIWRKRAQLWLRMKESDRLIYEVRYERLAEEGAPYLREILGWFDIDMDLAALDAIMKRNTIDALKLSQSSDRPWDIGAEPAGFFRVGEPNAWRSELRPEDIRQIEAIAGEEMQALGYRPDR
jgi:hypothetical protein